MKDTSPILVRVPNWIGDAVMCLPALEAIHRLYPDRPVIVAAKPRVVPVFEHAPYVKDIIEYDDRGRHRGVMGRLRFAGEIKKRGFGLAVLFQNAFDAAFLSFISGIPERVGYGRDLRSPLLTTAIKAGPEIKKRHQIFYYLHIVKALGAKMPPKPPVPRLKISASEERWAENFLKEHGLAKRPLAGAAPGASYGQAKRWPAKAFSHALNAVAKRRKAAILIFGGPDDIADCDAVYTGLDWPERVNLCAKLTLGESMALMAQCAVFITNDSGPMHLAAALGVPTVAVFGSTDAGLTGPTGPSVSVIQKSIDCSPCFKRECRYGHYKCLTEIDADAVADEACGLMKKARKR
ncbi:MAG: lipopolysaccharide heptosyltransferase II [Deltaproteobacteria bacterium]|nr:lipopolysaccharide heptosyltransferase II [Deltaproteobacteria bacterium]